MDILDYFTNSEAVVLTEAEMNDPTIPTPITSRRELFDRYKEWVNDPEMRVEDDSMDDYIHGAISGIYLKPDTPAAKRLKAQGKKYPIFKETLEYEKWMNKNIKGKENMKKAIDELEHYANGD